MTKSRSTRTAQIALIACGVLVAVGTASVTAAAVASSAPPRVATAGFPSGGTNPGIFTDTCTRSRTAPDDPIMMPGMTGMSMQHDFFGNPAVDASSTSSALLDGKTTCTTSADASAYWTPVVYQNGKALQPQQALIYWRAPAQTASSVQTMPAGITMIAGNETATAPQSTSQIDWTCTTSPQQEKKSDVTVRADAPQDCPGGSLLRLVITFPNCWDGHTLDGKSKENVVYADPSGCPTSHPVQIPQIVFHVAYPTSSGASITLSTGPQTQGPPVTGHADFMDGWHQPTMNADVAACIDTQTRCGPVFGADATPRGGQVR
ncbi:MAG TPA: DUF1996 domain-containing protein [Leifsonia sp.]|nr:DUF1996 domain-containing protein [Leifsonia sp.]